MSSSFLATGGLKFYLFQNACMVYKHAYLDILLLLLSAFMLCVMKMPLKGEVGGCALNVHGNYILDHGKSWQNHGIVFLNFCGNPVKYAQCWIQPPQKFWKKGKTRKNYLS